MVLLTNRQLLILQVIVDDFIRSAQPVGSRSLAKKEEINLSSATIRNEMADLEELGYIEKTHTSSGRIPSEKGYRFYVDHLLPPPNLKEQEIYKLKSVFAERIYEFEKIVQKSAKLLSELTNYTAIVLGPKVKDNKLRQFQIIPLNNEQAIAIIVTDKGHVENKVFSLPKLSNPSDIEKLVNILNERLIGVPISDLQDQLYKETMQVLRENILNYDLILQSVAEVLNVPTHEKLFFGGKTNILSQPEFHDIDKVKHLMDLIEQEESIYHLLKKIPSGIHVKIGRENNLSAMENCSLITATYSVGDDQLGTIAILGPKRMEYSRVITLLKLLSSDMTNKFTKLFQSE